MSGPILEVTGLDAFYGLFQATFGISFTLGEGEVPAHVTQRQVAGEGCSTWSGSRRPPFHRPG